MSNLKILIKFEQIDYILEKDDLVEIELDACDNDILKYKSGSMIPLGFTAKCLLLWLMNCRGNMRTWNKEPCYFINGAIP